MEQHPVPQNITSYKFRLVGDMTLKQFLEVASGVGFAWLVYASPLNPLIKWPLLTFSAFFGVALAFFPIEERPLDVWILNFFKAIYRPTQFLWQKTNQPPDFLKPRAKKAIPKSMPISPKDRKKLEEYLGSLPPKEDKIDKEEKEKLAKIDKFFQEAVLADKPKLTPSPPPTTFYEPKTALEHLEETRTREELLRATGQLEKPEEKPEIPEMPAAPEETEEEAKKEAAAPVVEPAAPFAPPLKVKTEVVYQKPQEKAEAVQVASLPMPSTPTTPNILVGMTLTPKEEILTDTIIEIQDQNGYPVRALKSNKVGQFFIATPLPNGKYRIEAEHLNYKFAIMEIILKGEVVPPIQIKAREKIL